MTPTPVSFDLETFPIASGMAAPPMVCLSYQVQGEPAQLLTHDDAIAWWGVALDKVKALEWVLVGHNVFFDLLVMAEETGTHAQVFDLLDHGGVHDTLLRERLHDIAFGIEERSYSLANCSARRLGYVPPVKASEWRLRFGELVDTPLDEWPAEAVAYSIDDAELTLKLWERQHETFHAQVDGTDLYDKTTARLPNEVRQVQHGWALHLSAAAGIITDDDAVQKYLDQVNNEAANQDALLTSLGILRPNGSKNMAKFREVVEAAYKGHPPLTETGRVSCSRDTLEQSGDPDLVQVAKFGENQASAKRWRKWLTHPVLHPHYRLLATGRYGANSPPIQQLDRAGLLRQCFRARDGNVLVSCDYDQLEVGSLAQVLNDIGLDGQLRETVNSGVDLHSWTAAQMRGESYDYVKSRVDAHDPEYKRARQLAKVANFGFPGGLASPETLVDYARGYGVDLDPDEVGELRRGWLATFPEMQAYFHAIGELVGDVGGTVEQLRSGRVRGGTRYTAACNTYFQGLAADGALAAMYEVARAQVCDPESPLYGTWTVAFIHDELLVECPREHLDLVARELRGIMVQTMRQWLPDVQIDAGATAFYQWQKADPTYNTAGELVPVEEAE